MLERKIWEFNPGIVCRLLGLSFDEKGLKKIIKKIRNDSGRVLKSFQIHELLMQICADSNPGSKYLDKILKKRFEPYRKNINGYDQETLCRSIEKEEGVDDIPLSALVWLAVRSHHEEINEIEGRIFAALHMREHRALKFYDSLSRRLPDGKPEEILKKLEKNEGEKGSLQNRCKKLGGKAEQLRSEKKILEEEKRKLNMILGCERRLNEELKKNLEDLGGNSALDHIEILKKEKEPLKRDLERLGNINKMLMEQIRFHEDADTKKDPPVRKKDDYDWKEPAMKKIEERHAVSPLSLQEKKVAFFGGLDSLVPHYRQMVEGLGGVFYHHCGKDSNGKREVEKLVDKVDVVFCPVNINSHHACRCVKKACKLRNKTCYFLRSSGLNSLKESLLKFAGKDCHAGTDVGIRSVN